VCALAFIPLPPKFPSRFNVRWESSSAVILPALAVPRVASESLQESRPYMPAAHSPVH
jgi:hypothetical protein